jgi:hypothetical protein
MITIKAGETVRIYCESCETEFDLTLEPKTKEHPRGMEGVQADFEFCPFCASAVESNNSDNGESEDNDDS